MTDIGHNGINPDHLRAYVERVERLQEERKNLSQDIADIYAEARGTGFDVKALKEVVKLRGQDRDKRRAHEEMVDLYRSALGVA